MNEMDMEDVVMRAPTEAEQAFIIKQRKHYYRGILFGVLIVEAIVLFFALVIAGLASEEFLRRQCKDELGFYAAVNTYGRAHLSDEDLRIRQQQINEVRAKHRGETFVHHYLPVLILTLVTAAITTGVIAYQRKLLALYKRGEFKVITGTCVKIDILVGRHHSDISIHLVLENAPDKTTTVVVTASYDDASCAEVNSTFIIDHLNSDNKDEDYTWSWRAFLYTASEDNQATDQDLISSTGREDKLEDGLNEANYKDYVNFENSIDYADYSDCEE